MLQIQDLSIDLDNRTVSRDGSVLDIRGLSFRVLACLARHAPAIVSIDTLAQEAWGQSQVSEAAMSKRIEIIRRALGDTVTQQRYILTHRNEGYSLISRGALEVAPRHERPAGVQRVVVIAASLVIGVVIIAASLSRETGSESTSQPAPAINAAGDMLYQYTRIDGETGAVEVDLRYEPVGQSPFEHVDPETGTITSLHPVGDAEHGNRINRLMLTGMLRGLETAPAPASQGRLEAYRAALEELTDQGSP